MDRYEEALERAKKGLPIDEVFPELKGSEDERIIDDAIQIIRASRLRCAEYSSEADKHLKAIAWLKKQKEQNQTRDNALQKAFINSKIDYTLEEKCDASDYAETILPTSVTYGEGKEEYKLHKIIEAAFIAGQKKEQKPVHTAKEMWKEMRLEVYAQASGNRHEPNYSDDSTKMFSLCDIDEIFEKIGDSTVGSQSAEWSEDERIRKILIHIVKGACDKYGIKYKGDEITEEKLLAYLEKQKEQKPVISDEAIRDGVVHFGITQYQINNWLKKHINVVEQQPAEWSEEDERTLESFLGWLQGSMGEKTYSSWLKSLPERFSLKPKQEWSEEDKGILLSVKCVIDEVWHDKNNSTDYPVNELEEMWNWLNTIWERVEYPQPHWKPSEEQMKALLSKLPVVKGRGNKVQDILEALYDDLKKLL